MSNKQKISGLKEVMKLKIEIQNLKTSHLNDKVELIRQMSDKAIDAALTSNNERLDASNHKYALLKDQANELASKEELKSVIVQLAALQKMVYIGLGAVLVLQFLSKFFLK